MMININRAKLKVKLYDEFGKPVSIAEGDAKQLKKKFNSWLKKFK